jgi:uncharacterized protein (DUF433 family)
MSSMAATLTISQTTYELLEQQAQATQRPLEELADELLRAHVQLTNHPYIVQREGFRGRRPILRGSNIPVWLIAAMWKAGDSPEEIRQAYPHLEPAAIYDAISYYLDHQQEVEAEIAENRIERVLADTGAKLDEDGVIIFSDPHA